MRSSFSPLWFALMAVALMTLGCGGSSGSSSTSTSPPTPAPAPVGGGAIAAPNVITVAAGQNAAGTNIVVPAPAISPALNIIALGVTTGSGGSASNTGALIARGATKTVLIFGAGLSASDPIAISGPNDITISNPQSIVSTPATGGIPGIAFQAAVASSAALGARTVVVTDMHGDIATFTGGLEVTQ